MSASKQTNYTGKRNERGAIAITTGAAAVVTAATAAATASAAATATTATATATALAGMFFGAGAIMKQSKAKCEATVGYQMMRL